MTSGSAWRASCGSCHCLLDVLTCSLLLFIFAPVQAANTTLVLTSTPSATTKTGNVTNTIAFSSAVQLASSISWQLNQLASIPALLMPTNITATPGYEIVSRLAPALPPIQAGVAFPDADGDDCRTDHVDKNVSSSQIDQCQQNIDNNLDAVQSYLENERSCCSASSKAKRQASGGMLSSLLHHGLVSLGLSLYKRADYLPNPNENPKQPPGGQFYATYTWPHGL